MNALLAGLCTRIRPHAAQLVLWVVVLLAWSLVGFTAGRATGARGDVVSLLGWLPSPWLTSLAWLDMFRALFLAGSALWLMQLAIPWSSWTSALGFTGLICLHQQNLTYVDHIFQLTNQLLLAYALWYHFYRRDIRDALRRGSFWTELVCPGWLHPLCIWLVAIYYAFGGWSKVAVSGFGWPNGVSLQLWVTLWGNPASPFTGWILDSRDFARLASAGILAVECGAVLALHPRLRPWIGAALLAFHIVNETVFGFQFQANAVIVALTLLPVQPWLQRRIDARLSRSGPPSPLQIANTVSGRLRAALVARLDVLGRHPFEKCKTGV
jgi:hypothetical protein